MAKKKKKDISNIPIDDVELDDVLNTQGRRIIFNCLMQGMSLKKAAKQAKLSVSYVQNWVMRSDLQALVKREQAKIATMVAAELSISEKRVLKELGTVGFSDIAELLAEDGTLKDLRDIQEETRRAIASVEIFEEFEGRGKSRKFVGYTKKIKLWDKIKALETIGKHLGMYALDNNQKRPIIAVQFNLNTQGGHD